jgi:hypothetical protein
MSEDKQELKLRDDRPLFPGDPELARLRAIETTARAMVEESAVECWDPDCQVKPLRLRQLQAALSPLSPEKPA